MQSSGELAVPAALPHDDTVVDLASPTLHVDALETCRRLLANWKAVASDAVTVR